MKLGQKVKVISSMPQPTQDPITNLIGKEFTVIAHWQQKSMQDIFEAGEIQVKSSDDEEVYCLNKGEYELI